MKQILSSFFLIFIAIHSLIAQPTSYNQEELYVHYEFDSIISDQGLNHSLVILSTEGKFIQKYIYCKNGNLLLLLEYDAFGISTDTKQYSCSKKDELISERSSFQKKNKVFKTISFQDKEDQPVSNTNLNNEGQIKSIKYYDSEGGLSYSQKYSHDKKKDIKTIVNLDADNDVISKEVIESDDEGRESYSVFYENKKKVSAKTFEYDEFGNLKRQLVTKYPSKKMEQESLYYYSTKFKLDSTKQYFGEHPDKYNSTIFYYDERGLKEKEVRTDRINQKVMVTHYKYH